MISNQPITLEGKHVRLAPLTIEHTEDLCRVGLYEDLWQWTLTVIRRPEDMQRYITEALAQQTAGKSIPFVTIDKAENKIVGSTRFCDINRETRNLEIGYTWITPTHQRTAINTEAKFLMLRQAFEEWQALRVFLKTDVLNLRSRRAIERSGATQEGIFRRHLITQTGRIRDSVYYSVIDENWAQVKAKLEQSLRK